MPVNHSPVAIVKDPQGDMHMLVIEHMTGTSNRYHETHVRPDVSTLQALAVEKGYQHPGASLTRPPENPYVEGAYKAALGRWEKAHTHGAIYPDAIGRPPRPGFEHLPPAPDRPLVEAVKDPAVSTNELRAIAQREVAEAKVRAARDWERGLADNPGLAGLEAFPNAAGRIGAQPLQRNAAPGQTAPTKAAAKRLGGGR